MNWDELFIMQATVIAQKSKDPSTKVGCVIVGDDNAVLSMGFNGFPRGINENNKNRWKRPEKYQWVEHAERNAIYNAARNGINLKGSRLYLNWEPRGICSDCARALIQVGVKEIIGPDKPFTGKGAGKHYSVQHAEMMLDEVGIKVRVIPMYQLADAMEEGIRNEEAGL
jgi:dCMP deaminase